MLHIIHALFNYHTLYKYVLNITNYVHTFECHIIHYVQNEFLQNNWVE